MYRDYYNITPQEFLIDKREEFGTVIKNVRYDLSPAKVCYACPECGSLSFVKHGISYRKVRDLSEYGMLVGLVIKVQRYLCKDCGATWSDSFESIDEKAKMTNRMRAYIQRKALERPFLSISKELDISVSTVKRVFAAYAKELDDAHEIVAPRVLGMDENYLNGKYRGMYVDIENRIFLDMTPDRKLNTVTNWIEKLPQKENIECVTIDMWGPYKEAVMRALPGVPIVVDKFHVIKHVQEALDSIRKKLRDGLTKSEQKHIKNNRWLLLRAESELSKSDAKRLQTLLEEFPQFVIPHKLKEQFRDIYLAESREEAYALFGQWKKDSAKYPEYADVVATIDNWNVEIFNYFDYHYTNATTESLNKIAKEIAAKGRGYNYDVLRVKVIYGTRPDAPSKYKYYPSDT